MPPAKRDPTTTASEQTWRFSRVFAASWILFTLLSAAWSIATPLGGSPDEPAHVIKAAAVVRGEFVGEPGQGGELVHVPAYVAYEQTCFAFHPNVTAACARPAAGDQGRLVEARTTAGLYNPTYYLLVGWPSLFLPDSSGVFAMRIISGILVSLFLALTLALITKWRRPTLPLVGFAAAVTPMTLFLAGQVNPNSLEIAATMAAFVGVLSITRGPERPRLGSISVIVFAASAVAANMRGLSLLWLVLALLSPLVLVDRRRLGELLRTRAIRLAMVGTAVAAIGAAVWLLTTNSLVGSPDDTGPAARVPGAGESAVSGFIWTLTATFSYARGIVGDFGWLDTPAPDITNVIWSLLAGGLLVMGIIALRGRALPFIGILFAAVLLLPAILQGIYIHSGGVIWQGRYILPLFVCLMVALGSSLGQQIALPRGVLARLTSVVLCLWAVAQFASFATALKRYAAGLNSGWLTLLHPRWNPPGGVLLSLIIFASLLTVAVITLLLWLRRRREPEPEGTPPEVVAAV